MNIACRRPLRARCLATVCLLGICLLANGHASPAPKASPAPATPAATPVPPPVATVAAADIPQEAPAAIARVNAMAIDSPADQMVAAARQLLPVLTTEVDQWVARSNSILSQRPSLDDLSELQSGGRKLADGLDAPSALLTERARALDANATQLNQDRTLWTATLAKVTSDASVPADTLAQGQAVLAAVSDAAARIRSRWKDVLELQSRFSEQTARLQAGLDAVGRADAAALKSLFLQDSPPLWRMPKEANTAPPDNNNATPNLPARAAIDYARQHLDLLGLHGALILLLLGLILWLRRGLHKWTEEEPHLKRAAPIFEVPIATAIALSFVARGLIYADPPIVFKTALGTLALLPIVVLLRRLLDPRLHPALYSLILFYFVGQVLTALVTHPVETRWIFSAEMPVVILVFWWISQTHGDRTDAEQRAVLGRGPRFLCRLAMLILAGALAAEVLGYVGLGTTVGAGVLRSTYAAVFLYAVLQVLAGLLLIALRVRPLSISHIARQHHAAVHRQVYRALRLIAFLSWGWLTLNFLEMQNPVREWAAGALAYELPGSLHLTLEKLLGCVLAIWLSMLVARLTRFFLEEEVFERIQLSPGLPYAIATMLNYLVLFVGFLIALGTLGVGLSQITLLAGAFSVGLGFGLQNIINNFVSGIILLFERPVKVGDVIQIGDALGEVRRIGIRASVIGTRDGSAIIVPNGNLISNQFTNWTYSDRQRSVEIPLGIASGPDPNHVLALLKAAAAAHAATKEQPAPEAYITALTASGISLTVCAWISHYEDWVQTRSELSVALVEALTRENIKLA